MPSRLNVSRSGSMEDAHGEIQEAVGPGSEERERILFAPTGTEALE